MENKKMTKRETEKRDVRAIFARMGVKSGDTIYTILRHVSKSGMLREISLIWISPTGETWDCTYTAACLLGNSIGNHRGIRVSGCGMDMGFHLVYELSRLLFPNGFGCIGDRCPSNDHSNGHDNAHHKDGGYALGHRWM